MSTPPPSPLSPAPSSNTQSFDQIPHTPLQWLWHPYLPLGKITLLLGDPDAGKSLLSLHLAAELSQGSAPFSSPSNPSPLTPTPSSTLLLAAEDEGPRDTLRPRLEAAGAHLPSIHRLPNFHSLVPPHPTKLNPHPPHPLARIEAALNDNPAIKLLIIDSLPAFLGHSDHLNPSAAQDPSIPRTLLASLAAIAEQYQIAILAITRLTKSVSPKLLHRAAGSHAFTFRAKSALLLSVDPEAPASNRRLLIPLKHTLTAPPPALAFHITPGTDAPTLAWEQAPLPLTPDQISQLTPPEHRRDPVTSAAAGWLASALAAGPLSSSTVIALARSNCINPTTLNRAKEQIGALSVKEGKPINRWWWKLPADPTPIPPPPTPSPAARAASQLANLTNNLRELAALKSTAKKLAISPPVDNLAPFWLKNEVFTCPPS